MALPLIPATVIGSWSFPGWYEKFIADVRREPRAVSGRPIAKRPSATRCDWRSTTSLCAGLDRITDGEMQRVDFNLGFYEYLQGLEPIPPCSALGRAGPRPARPLPLRSRR